MSKKNTEEKNVILDETAKAPAGAVKDAPATYFAGPYKIDETKEHTVKLEGEFAEDTLELLEQECAKHPSIKPDYIIDAILRKGLGID